MTRAQKIAIGLGVAAAAFAVFLGPTVVDLVRGPVGSVPPSPATMRENGLDQGIEIIGGASRVLFSTPARTGHSQVRCFYPPERETFPAPAWDGQPSYLDLCDLVDALGD